MIKTGPATEQQVRSVRLPDHIRPTRTFAPLTHDEVLTRLESRMDILGLGLERDQFGRTRKEFTLANDGAKMYVALPLTSRIDPEMKEMVVIVHSFDKTLALRIGFGSECSYCTNGLVFAALVMKMKHCPGTLGKGGVNIDNEIDDALKQRGFFADQQKGFYNRLRETELGNKDVNDMLVRSMDSGAIKATEIPHVLEQWQTPRFEAFAPRTAFSLLNAYTDVYRRGGANRTNGVATRNGPVFVERSTKLVNQFASEYASDLNIEFDPLNN